jgi:hypothetical protein
MVGWLDQANRIESAADRREFLHGVTGAQGVDSGKIVLAGILAWTLFGGRRK